ncbi:nuclear transport factor 2 family protein [Flagellimonas algicola]|uniref:Nuclear transport factor 2 family protein n=1 Tax=Flagellimonas algicola TaxID=2583815 RepID=A0ABY2WK13_9FLAO|nr:nuclear transport factor 2 family protein [Allomuricauda algicola]TMU55178.1 nuclear transport factor 2 family protein [Allomuricauda algicola]
MFGNSIKEIETVVSDYFNGIYQGDVELLRSVFSKNAMLYGDIKGQPYEKELDAYLETVKQRKSPKDLKEDFKMEIVGVELMGRLAVVKAHLPMLGYNYYDFLSLYYTDGKWSIVNKLFAHVE